MKTSQLLFATLLSLGFSSAARAQTTVPSATGTPSPTGVPGSPASPITPSSIGTGTNIPGQPGVPGTVLPGTSSPVGTLPSTIYSPGTTPAGTPGTLRGNQPVGTSPGDAPARSIRRTPSGARTNTGGTTNRATVRP